MPEGTKYPPPVFDAKTLSPPPAPPLRPIPRPTVELALLKIREQSSPLPHRPNVPPEPHPHPPGGKRPLPPRHPPLTPLPPPPPLFPHSLPPGPTAGRGGAPPNPPPRPRGPAGASPLCRGVTRRSPSGRHPHIPRMSRKTGRLIPASADE